MRKRAKPVGNPAEDDSSQYSTALVRGLQILRAFTPTDASLGNQDLIDRTGLPKATVSRLTFTLVGLGYLTYDEALGRYSIGPATVSLGYSGLSTSAVIHMAKPLMQAIADDTGLAIAMGTRDALEMIYLANSRSEAPVTLRLNVGSRLPIWSTAMGLAYLCGMEDDIRDRIVGELVRADPGNRKRIEHALVRAMDEYQANGFVTSLGDWFSYINAVGVPFRPTDGSQLVAITCGGIRDMAPEDICRDNFGPRLRRLTKELQARLAGAQPNDRPAANTNETPPEPGQR